MKKILTPKIIIYCVCMLLVIIYLFAANDLVLVFGNEESPISQIKFSDLQETVEPTFDGLWLSYLGGIKEEVYVQANAYCDVKLSEGRKINIVFKNYDIDDDIGYICYNEAQQYGSIKRAAYAQFSTYMIPKGDYEVYLNVVDNEEIYGVVDTDRIFRKTENDFYEISKSEKILENSANASSAVTAVSGENLLINSDFSINQRGQTEYTGRTYTVDHWFKNRAGTVTVDDGKIKLDSEAVIRQLINKSESFDNQLMTISMKVNGVVRSSSFVFEKDNSSFIMYLDSEIRASRYINECGSWIVLTTFVENVEIEWIKLELGNTATPYSPPEPATELMKCQRYYQIYSTPDVPEVDIRPSMRATPVITELSEGRYAYDAEVY
ncbi:MAG: hypothetical protein J1F04_02160 [Oscillospiraceae bacterium]|nr:hypothetical protein [Oscillospiraceae bacterium]